VSDEATNLINPEPNTSLTGLCLICHNNLMRCILYIKYTLSHVDQPEQKRLNRIRKNLEEDYLRLDLWITDSCPSKGHDFLALGPPIAKPIQTSLSAIHEQLLLAKAEIYALRQKSKLGPDFELRFLRIEAACQSITSQMRILAKMQGLIHNAQADQFPEIGPRAYLHAEIADVFQKFQDSDADPKSTDDEIVTEDSFSIPSKVGGQKCEQCGNFFQFGTLELHYEFRHSEKEPKLGTSVTPFASELFYEEALDDIPTPQETTPWTRLIHANPSGPFYIRNNLNAALLRLRDPYDDVNVWVDALCINHENNAEKAAQVSRTHEIYGQAENVYIWLGVGKESTTETFCFLREILDLPSFDALLADPIPTARKWALIVDLMRNRLFGRRWILQEIAFSRNACVLWGDEELEWSSFADAIGLFMAHYDTIKRESLDPAGYYPYLDARSFAANIVVNASTNLFRKLPNGSITQRLLPLEVLVTCSLLALQASAPRDAIFAVGALAKDSQVVETDTRAKERARDDPRISPDYEKSLLDVYTDFIDYCIERSGSLDILCRGWAPLPMPESVEEILKRGISPRGEELPSWIPLISRAAFGAPHVLDNGRINGDSFVGAAELQGRQIYSASGHLRPWAVFGISGIYESPQSLSEPQSPSWPPRKFGLSSSPTFMDRSRRGSDEISRLDLGSPDIDQSGMGRTADLSDLESTTSDIWDTQSTASKDFSDKGSVTTVDSADAQFAIALSRLRNMPISAKAPEDHDGTLSVRGFILETITECSGRVVGKGIVPVEALTMGGWDHRNPDNKEVPDQLWRTLVADRGPDGAPPPLWYRHTCLACLHKTDRVGDLDIEDLKRRRNISSLAIAFLERVQCVIWGRRFFKTKGKTAKNVEPFFGLGPSDLRLGDTVCILFGCSVPIILRKVSGDQNSQFKFIGGCYVHGVMDGEAISGKPPPAYPYVDKKSNISTFKIV
jgi:hypothetical protein